MSEINKAKLKNDFKNILNNKDSLTNNCDLPKIVANEENKLFNDLYHDYQTKFEKITDAIIEAID